MFENATEEERSLWDGVVHALVTCDDFRSTDDVIDWANELVAARRKAFGQPDPQ